MTNSEIQQRLLDEYGEDKLMIFAQMVAKYHSYKTTDLESEDDDSYNFFYWNQVATTLIENKIKELNEKE